jgi:hypothetical protein
MHSMLRGPLCYYALGYIEVDEASQLSLSVEYVHWTIVLLSSWIRGEDAGHFSLSLSCVDLSAVRYVGSKEAGHLNLSLV